MRLQLVFSALVLLFLNMLQAQEISVKVIDAKTKVPVSFATIKTGENRGVITNEEGSFVINTEILDNETIEISCMGYESKSILVADLSDNQTILLDAAINQLETVFLTNNKPNVDSIIKRVNRYYKTNYQTDNLKYQFFKRETSYAEFEKLELEIDRASEFSKEQIRESNAELRFIADEIKNSNSIRFDDFKGQLAVLDESNSKLNIDKATEIHNSNENFSIEAIQEKAVGITLKFLDTTQTYKLKTGWFKIEDSLSLVEENKKNKDTVETVSVESLKSAMLASIKDGYVGYESVLRTVLDADSYDYQLENAAFFNDELIYEIAFEPRRSSAKYIGKLYVSDESFAVSKLYFKYADGKRGSKLNLRLVLGVKYIENVHQGTLIFIKAEDDYYVPRYIGNTTGKYIYVSRPLKFIENSADKNKTSLSFKLEGQVQEKTELLFENVSKIDRNEFQLIETKESVIYERLRKYDANKWTGSETLAPTEELRKFEVSEK